MPSTTRRPSAAADRRAELAARVAAAIARLLAEGASYTQLGVERIASTAGISRSTFYLYYRDKTDVLLRLSEPLRAGLFELARDWRPDAPDGPGGGLSGLVDVYVGILAHHRAHATVLAAVGEVIGYDRALSDVWLAEQERFADQLARLLAAEQHAGRASADFDAGRAARVLVCGAMQVFARQVSHGSVADDAAVARELAESHWFGTYRRR